MRTQIATDVDGDETVRLDMTRDGTLASIPYVCAEWWSSLTDRERYNVADRALSDEPGTDVWIPRFLPPTPVESHPAPGLPHGPPGRALTDTDGDIMICPACKNPIIERDTVDHVHGISVYKCWGCHAEWIMVTPRPCATDSASSPACRGVVPR
ncbi:hypothetical protein LCGC14_0723070 [marine sediment metagenome]|uniref:Uncharacterized protein n=1 Tax=marine sediment metagenome TaxID=412755 RepID=A0A0F9SX33_9ZZZZ